MTVRIAMLVASLLLGWAASWVIALRFWKRLKPSKSLIFSYFGVEERRSRWAIFFLVWSLPLVGFLTAHMWASRALSTPAYVLALIAPWLALAVHGVWTNWGISGAEKERFRSFRPRPFETP